MKISYVALTVLFCIGLKAEHNDSLLNLRLLTKFSFAVDPRVPYYHKVGGALALENQFHRFFTAGLLVGGAWAKQDKYERCDKMDPSRCERVDAKLAIIDFAFYVKPQIPIQIGNQYLTPYLSLAAGPAITVLFGKAAASHYYAALLGLDYCFADHWMVFFESGIQANLRFLYGYFIQFPLTLNTGLGFRF